MNPGRSRKVAGAIELTSSTYCTRGTKNFGALVSLLSKRLEYEGFCIMLGSCVQQMILLVYTYVILMYISTNISFPGNLQKGLAPFPVRTKTLASVLAYKSW